MHPHESETISLEYMSFPKFSSVKTSVSEKAANRPFEVPHPILKLVKLPLPILPSPLAS